MGKLLGVTSYPDPLPRDLDWKVVMTLRVSSITLSMGGDVLGNKRVLGLD